MAVLNREDFLSLIRSRIGEEMTDEDMIFIENVSDTYDDLAGKAEGSVDWEKKYSELRQKYIDRFTSATDTPEEVVDESEGTVVEEDEVYTGMLSYDELFEEGV